MNEPVTKSGDIWNLGEHRVLCGDSTKGVEELMQGKTVSLVLTSPPYANKRDYTKAINDWTHLMQGVFFIVPTKEDAQILVNLGVVHQDNQWMPYWNKWLDWMPAIGWRRFGFYVWDQMFGLPGDWHGRLAPSHEFVFHFNKVAKRPNKIIDSKWGNHHKASGTGPRRKDGTQPTLSHVGRPIQMTKIPDSVIRITRQTGSGIETEHPAVFPIRFPEFLIRTFSNEGDAVYEPFAGSGTTLMAAELTKRLCYCVEIAPEYVDIIVRRYIRMFPGGKVTLEGTDKNFFEVAKERGVEVPADQEVYRTGTGTKRIETITTLAEFI